MTTPPCLQPRAARSAPNLPGAWRGPRALRRARALLALCAAATLATAAGAQGVAAADGAAAEPGAQREQRRISIDAARATSDVGMASVGIQLPWAWRRDVLGGELSGHWDVHAAHWRVAAGSAAPGRRQWTQLAVVPALRLRFDGGRSPWFVEGGIGLSWIDGHYETQHKKFSTRFNFTDHLGVGVNFGERWQHELMLAVRHVSNGGFRKPNPGENFVQLRYAMAF